MAVSYQIDPATRVIRIMLAGDVTVSDITTFLRQTEADPFFDRRMHRLVLADDVTALPDEDEIAGLAGHIQDRLRGNDARIAVVASSPASSNLASIFLTHAGVEDRFAVFAQETEAWRWLLRLDHPRP